MHFLFIYLFICGGEGGGGREWGELEGSALVQLTGKQFKHFLMLV